MQSLPFVNIHSHKYIFGQDVSIENVFVQERHKKQPEGLYSLGLHPWHITDLPNNFDIISTLEYYIEKDKKLIAIGEIGLDNSISIPFHLQKELFEKQLLIAQQYNLPVIIHCVKAYSELINSKKKLGITIPMIIHGYNGNRIDTTELLKHGFYFSFGKMLMLGNKHSYESSLIIPYNKLFLETDESSFSIVDAYLKMAEFKSVTIDFLLKELYDNFKLCFKM